MLSGAKNDRVTHALLPASPSLGARASRPHAGELPALPNSPTASFSLPAAQPV